MRSPLQIRFLGRLGARASGFSLVFLGMLVVVASVRPAEAQPLTPDRSAVFSSDSAQARKEQDTNLKKSLSPGTKASEGLDFQAPSIEFNRDTDEMVAKGGILISEGGVQVQADEGTFNMKTKEGDVSGNVLMTTSAGVLSASAGHVNIPSETGTFKDLEFDIEEGGFNINSDEALKVSEFEFQLQNTDLTSCHCPDGTKPWEIKAGSCNITQEGYAHIYNPTMWFEGMPIFYSPYLAVPVKRERASGLLTPQAGYSNQNGVLYRQPIFFDLDDSTGATLSPFVATNSRVGAELDFEKRFSAKSRLDAGFIYSNESLRFTTVDGQRVPELRGLDLDGVSDTTIDENRTAGFYKQRWRSDPIDGNPVEAIIDARYTSDDLLLREIPAPQIGAQQSQYLASSALVRGQPFSLLSAELRSEYTQSLTAPQDIQFQRLPELALGTGSTFRPFGSNPYGLKLVAGLNAVGTEFYREQYYDGSRVDIAPQVSVPFHVKNYFRGAFSAQLHQTEYSMNDRVIPPTVTPTPAAGSSSDNGGGSDEEQLLDSSMSRTLPILSYNMTTGVERVFSLERDNWFSRAVGLGAKNEGTELVRLKHTIEPTLGYTYIPSVDQNNNPLYDELDRFRERSLFSYGFTTRLYGKVVEPIERVRDVEELAPSADTLPMYDLSDSLLAFGRNMVVAPPAYMDARDGTVRQLGQFSMRQTYDSLVDQQNDDPSLDAFSDINAALSLSPSYYFSTGFEANYKAQEGDFSSFSYSIGIRDDRDDALRARYTFIDQSINQIEMNAETKIFEQLKAGLYGRYDADASEWLESRGLFRFINACKCWSADLGLGQTFNPDNKQILFSFTFGGLGGISQGGGMTQY